MTVLIIEDEELAAITLQNMLVHINPEIQVHVIVGTVEAAVKLVTAPSGRSFVDGHPFG